MTDEGAFLDKEYPYGFVTPVESETAPRGLNEDIIRFISKKKMNRNLCCGGGLRRFGSGKK